MTWWLIEDETVQRIRLALQAAIERVNEQCARDGCLCDLGGNPCSQFYSDALHALDSGLNRTDAVPGDWLEPILAAESSRQ